MSSEIVTAKEQGYIDATLSYMQAHPRRAAYIVFALAFAENVAVVSFLVPATGILMAMSVMLAAQRVNPLPLLLGASLGAALGFSSSYWIGLVMHEPILHSCVVKAFPGYVEASQAFFDSWGIIGVTYGHFNGPIRAVVSFVAGMLEMDRLKFELANIVGATLWGFLMLLPVFVVQYVPISVQGFVHASWMRWVYPVFVYMWYFKWIIVLLVSVATVHFMYGHVVDIVRASTKVRSMCGW